MVIAALQNLHDKKRLKKYLLPLVESIAEKYADSAHAQKISRTELIKAGWSHFDIALKNYLEKTELTHKLKNNQFYFSTYFTWYIRQGIVEYIEHENKN